MCGGSLSPGSAYPSHGGVALLATLIYLAVQIRHGTESNLASTQSGIQSEYNRLHETVISGPELVRILERVARP